MMEIEITASVDTEEVLEQIDEEFLVSELQDRGYIVFELSSSPKEFKNKLVDLMNDYNGDHFNYHSDKSEILDELENIL